MKLKTILNQILDVPFGYDILYEELLKKEQLYEGLIMSYNIDKVVNILNR